MQQYDGQGVGVPTRLLNSFFRHRWLFLLAVCVVTGVSTGVLKMRKETYKATAQTQVVSDKQLLVDALGEQTGYALVNSAQNNVNQMNDMLGDDGPGGFLDTALKNAQLDRPISVDPRVNDPRFGMLRKRLVVAVAPDSDALFTISLTWDNPQECERIVEALQKQFIEDTGLNRQATSIATTKFLESEKQLFEGRMEVAEQALIDYKKNNAGKLPDSQASDVQELAQLKVERDTLVISSQDASNRRQALEERLAQVKPLSILAKTMTDSPTALAIKALQTKRALLIAEKDMPTGEYVGFVDKQIADLKAQMKSEASDASGEGTVVSKTDLHDNPEWMALDRDLTLAKIAETTQSSQVAEVDKRIAEYEARAKKIPDEQKVLNEKTRGYLHNKTQYDSLVERQEQALLKAKLDKIAARSTLLPVGTVYAEPSTPKSKRMIMFVASIVAGFLVGVIVVIYAEWSDQTLRYGTDVERLLGLPLLGEVPETRQSLAPLPKPITLNMPRSRGPL